MSLFARRPWTRWAVPASALALVAAGTVAASTSATADPTLPERTPAQLLVDIQSAKVTGLSGTVVQTADLSSTIMGTHTWRVWYAGDTKARLALLGQGSESDIIRNGTDVWMWSSTTKTATHYTVPANFGPKKDADAITAPRIAEGLATPLPSSPQDAADKALALLDPSTEVTAPGTTTVAGRAAYQLVLTPRAKESLVASVRIAVDAETKVPLRVQVMSTRIATPAFEVGFSAVDFGTPDDHTFTFTPPPGTTVEEGTSPLAGIGDKSGAVGKGVNPMVPGENPRLPATPGSQTPVPGMPGVPAMPGMPAGLAMPSISGTGWATVIVATMPKSSPSTSTDAAPDARPAAGPNPLEIIQGAMTPVSGSWGSGRVLEGTIFTAIITDDGRMAIGAVGSDTLQGALAAGPIARPAE